MCTQGFDQRINLLLRFWSDVMAFLGESMSKEEFNCESCNAFHWKHTKTLFLENLNLTELDEKHCTKLGLGEWNLSKHLFISCAYVTVHFSRVGPYKHCCCKHNNFCNNNFCFCVFECLTGKRRQRSAEMTNIGSVKRMFFLQKCWFTTEFVVDQLDWNALRVS